MDQYGNRVVVNEDDDSDYDDDDRLIGGDNAVDLCALPK